MQITFDPTIPAECAVIARLLGTTAAPVQPVETAPEPDRSQTGASRGSPGA
jgi:hypothetical protein